MTAALPKGKPGKKNPVKPYLFLLPMLIFAVSFVYYPFIKTVLQSFSYVNFQGKITGFAGLDNYRYLFGRREFGMAIRNTLLLAFVNVPVTVLITLSLAMLANRRRRLSPVYETSFSLSMAVSMSIAAMTFKVLLNPTIGYINQLFGLSIGWYTDRHTAMAGILMLTVWMGIGFNFLLFLSALRAVPQQLIDAAQLEGAGKWQCFLRVQLPLISPTILYVVCTNMIQAIMTSGPIIVLTQGGPSRSTTTLIYMMYTSGISSSNYALAGCISILTFLMTLACTIGLFIVDGRKVHY